MKNEQFIQQRQEIIVSELTNFIELETGKYLRTFDNRKLFKEDGIDFVKFKLRLITLIKNSDEKALHTRLDYLKSKLCPFCRMNLKNDSGACVKDYQTYIACLWIQRSLN